MEFSSEMSCEDFAAYLEDNNLHEDVISNVISNRVTSSIFLDLTENDLKELAPAVGDRIALRKYWIRRERYYQKSLTFGNTYFCRANCLNNAVLAVQKRVVLQC